MEPLIRIEAIAAILALDNIDTDAIIPSRETQSVARTGYGEKLFANWRYTPGTRIINPDFVLNRPPFDGAQILVAGQNFGCGSSREAAVWALKQFGIRVVIAGSFGPIFYNNCIRNGLLPVQLEPDELADLLVRLNQNPATERIAVDLETCRLEAAGASYAFSIAERDRDMLMSGSDEIALTLRQREAIDGFRAGDRADRPWLYRSRESET